MKRQAVERGFWFSRKERRAEFGFEPKISNTGNGESRTNRKIRDAEKTEDLRTQ